MNLSVTLTIMLVLMMAVMVAALVGGIIYLDSNPTQNPPASTTLPTTTTSTSTTTTESTSTTIPATVASIEASSTTSTIALRPLSVTVPAAKLYKFDDANLTVASDGTPVRDGFVYLDGNLLYQASGYSYPLLSLDGGDHKVTVSAEGYENATVAMIVAQTTYANSPERRKNISQDQKDEAFAEGKALISIYDNPGCPNCVLVINAVSKLVDNNRDCIIYQKLYYTEYSNSNSLKDYKGVVFPFPLVIVEGSRGRYTSTGLVSASVIRDYAISASGCRIE